ncbi:MAG: hypothetical protein AAF629_22780, partial [Chloroflexota bacterium]
MFWGGLILSIILLAIFIYWLVITTEGTYVGQWLVTLLYDRVADDYDDIKEYGVTDEHGTASLPSCSLAGPLPQTLSCLP